MAFLDRLLGLADPSMADELTPKIQGVPGDVTAMFRQQATEGLGRNVEQDFTTGVLAATKRSTALPDIGVSGGALLSSAERMDQNRNESIAQSLRQIRMESESSRERGRQGFAQARIGQQNASDQEQIMLKQMQAQIEFGNRAARRQFIGGVAGMAGQLGMSALMPVPPAPQFNFPTQQPANTEHFMDDQFSTGWTPPPQFT